MMQINRPLAEGDKPGEMLRRMLNARADDERRRLAPGEAWHKTSAKPLSPARIQRVYAALRGAMEAARRTGKIAAIHATASYWRAFRKSDHSPGLRTVRSGSAAHCRRRSRRFPLTGS